MEVLPLPSSSDLDWEKALLDIERALGLEGSFPGLDSIAPARDSDHWRYNCTGHNSASKNSAYISRNPKSGLLCAHCRTCDYDLDWVHYHHNFKHGYGLAKTQSPSGVAWIEVVKEAAERAGVILPKGDRPDYLADRSQQPSKRIVTRTHYSADGTIESIEQEEIDPIPFSDHKFYEKDGCLGYDEYVKKNVVNPESGAIEKKFVKEFIGKTDFVFEVTDVLDDIHGRNAGIQLLVKQASNSRAAHVLVRDEAMHDKRTLARAISSGYGSALKNTFTLDQLIEHIFYKQNEYIVKGGRRHSISACRGQQPRNPDGSEGYWVFEDIQFTPQGEVCTSEESNIIFCKNYGDETSIPNPKILPPDPDVLGKVMLAMRKALKEQNIFPGLFLVASQVMGLQYQKIHKKRGSVPMTNAVGDSGGGKSTSSRVARALVGLQTASAGDISEAALFENLKYLGSLSYTYEDPKKDPSFDENTKKIYEGEPRVKKNNTQRPICSLIVTSNHSIGRDGTAIMTRFNRIPFFKDDSIGQDVSDFDELNDLLDSASGAFQTLLKFGYDHQETERIRKEIDKYLPSAHRRISPNLSVLTFYALKLAPYAGLSQEQIMHYVSTVLCRVANDSDSGKSSVKDFVEKLRTLEERSLIGPWNYREFVRRDGKKVAAVKLTSVWSAFERNFQVQYDLQQIKADNEQNGGRNKDVKQAFAASQKEFQAWEIGKLNKNSDLNEYQKKVDRCIEIVLGNYGLDDEDDPIAPIVPNDNKSDPIAPVMPDDDDDNDDSIAQVEPEEPIEDTPEPIAVVEPVATSDSTELDENLIEIIMEEIEDVSESIEFMALANKYVKNRPEFDAAWGDTPLHIQDRIEAARNGDIGFIEKIRTPGFIKRDHFPCKPGQLVYFNDKLYWFLDYANPAEIRGPLHKEPCITARLVRGDKDPRFLPIKDLKTYGDVKRC